MGPRARYQSARTISRHAGCGPAHDRRWPPGLDRQHLVDREHAGAPRHSHYGASKAGLNQLTRVLAVELAPHRIRVNAILPGVIATPARHGSLASPAARAEMDARSRASRCSVSRVQLEDIVHLAVFLLSDALLLIPPVDCSQPTAASRSAWPATRPAEWGCRRSMERPADATCGRTAGGPMATRRSARARQTASLTAPFPRLPPDPLRHQSEPPNSPASLCALAQHLSVLLVQHVGHRVQHTPAQLLVELIEHLPGPRRPPPDATLRVSHRQHRWRLRHRPAAG